MQYNLVQGTESGKVTSLEETGNLCFQVGMTV